MNYWDFIDLSREFADVPDISEGFFIAFLKPKPKMLPLGEGAQRNKAIEEVINYGKRKRS